MLVAGTPPEKHAELNPVFATLVEQGISLNDEKRVPLPAPSMPDGLDKAAQEAVLGELLSSPSSLQQFLRNSIVAKHLLQMDTFGQPDAPARRVDVWFVTFGSLEAISSQKFLEGMLGSDAEDQDLEESRHEFTAEELKQRGIELMTSDPQREQFGYGGYELIKLVEVHGTMRSYWSRNSESLLFAAMLDHRFAEDGEYPNEWRPLERSAAGKLEAGVARPYRGMGMYMKITPLKAPVGALLVEGHVIFSEPHDWFDGANLLGSKLPAVVQKQVRTARREIVKASREE
jgi:hypothetical protein